MPFRPNAHDELTINSITYRIAEHPTAPGMPHGQEGRAGTVYCLLSSPTGREAGGESKMALKVFKPRFRLPYLVSQAEKLAALANLPGLQAAHRNVLTRTQNPHLLQQYPDLIYAVLMPWIEGPTWLEVMLDKHPLTSPQALDLARALAQVLETLELRGIAHCDLSAPNVMLPHLAGGTGVALVDLEGVYAPDMTRPQELSSGSAGYAHKQATGGLWGPEADRFAGAVLLAEMLGWCDEQVVQAAWGESYFDPQEMQQETPRYRTLVTALERQWGNAVAYLFERAWKSDTLLDCPTFGEWLVALPEAVGSRQSAVSSVQSSVGGGHVEASAEIRAFMQAARRMGERGNLEGALETYRQALEVARGDPTLRSLVWEIELTIEDVRTRYEAEQRARRQAEEQTRRAAEEGTQQKREEQARRKEGEARPRRSWAWLVGGLVVLALVIASAYSLNWQQQAIAQATAQAQATIAAQAQATVTTQAQTTATARAQATATAQMQATITAQAQATATLQAQATSTAQAQATATARAQAWRIAFHSDRDGEGEIYVMNADGSGQTNLTRDSAWWDWCPAWSPDGKKVAFTSCQGGNCEIYVMNADGTGKTRLTNNPANDLGPSWSPDGKRIAFQSKRDGNWEIYVMNADGSGLTRLTNDPSANSGSPSWSPDGKLIAFDSGHDGNQEIYVMNADGSGPLIRLTNHPATDWKPSWSPDGRRIVFTSNRDGDGNKEIYVMNADGSGLTRLTNHPSEDLHPSWSPDGRYIVFQSTRSGGTDIYVMNADGSGVTRLTSNPAYDGEPAWSPVP